jgi:hypothetical protein
VGKTATRTYPQPPPAVFSALLAGLVGTRLRIVDSDREAGVVRAKAGVSGSSWGEHVTISLQTHQVDHTSVTVESRFRFQPMAYGGVHQANFSAVFDMLDWAIGPSRALPRHDAGEDPGGRIGRRPGWAPAPIE